MMDDNAWLAPPLTDELKSFRDEVRAFFRDRLPPEMALRGLAGNHTLPGDMRLWARTLNARGWAAPHWPVEYDGTGWDPLRRYLFEEESVRAGAPRHGIQGLTLIGPVIYTFGSPEQKARFLPRILAGEDIWAQGFSEPGAGSDLASLRARAERRGDKWIINGQKIWTSEFHIADKLYCLVRTDVEVKKQRGLSILIMDTDTPGITSRPIIGLDGAHSLNEVFFDDVEVPADQLIGEANMGWTYAKFLLDNERAWAAEVPRIKRAFGWLVGLVEKRGAMARWRADLAEIAADIAAVEGLTLLALQDHGADDDWPVGNLLKVSGSELQQRIGELQLAALGADAMLLHDPYGLDITPDQARCGAGIVGDTLIRRAASIYGGANEVQRDIIANAALRVA